MGYGNLGVTCKLVVVSLNSFSLNIHDFISCRFPFQEPPNIHFSSSIQSLHLAQWKQMEESKVLIKAVFEYIIPFLKAYELETQCQHSATLWLRESLQDIQNSPVP